MFKRNSDMSARSLLCKCFAFVVCVCVYAAVLIFVFIFFLLYAVVCLLFFFFLKYFLFDASSCYLCPIVRIYACERVSLCIFYARAFYCFGAKERQHCYIACMMDETEDQLCLFLFQARILLLYSDFELVFFLISLSISYLGIVA